MPEINSDSYFYHLLEAQAARENNEDSPSKYASYGKPIDTITDTLKTHFCSNDTSDIPEKDLNTIRNISYSYQLLEFYIHAKKELYLSFPLNCMINKQLLIISFEIEQALLCLMLPDMYNKSANERDKIIKEKKLLNRSLIEKIDNNRKYRNKIHLSVTENNPDMDYQIFSDDSKVKESITILNSLLDIKIPKEKSISLDLI